MADVFNTLKRSDVMSKIRGQGNRSTELALADAFRRAKITGWRRHFQLKPRLATQDVLDSKKISATRILVRPDFVFRQARLVVFVDGCFWHQCPLHSKIPANNRAFWLKKLNDNVVRDARAMRALHLAGWRALRIWEHEMKDLPQVIIKVQVGLSGGAHSPKPFVALEK